MPRQALATHLLDGSDIQTVQELLGHAGIEPTMRDTHALDGGGPGVRRPADRL